MLASLLWLFRLGIVLLMLLHGTMLHGVDQGARTLRHFEFVALDCACAGSCSGPMLSR